MVYVPIAMTAIKLVEDCVSFKQQVIRIWNAKLQILKEFVYNVMMDST